MSNPCDIFLSTLGKEINFPAKGIMKQSAEAKGCAINASIGIALDDEGNPLILPSLLAQTTLSAKDMLTYAPSFGKPQLRKIWKKRIQELNPSLTTQMSLPVVTNGLTHGLSTCFQLFADIDTPLILPEYYRGNYKLIYTSQGKKNIVTYTMFDTDGLHTESFAETVEAITTKSIILFNFPNNPSGYVATKKELLKIKDILVKKAEEIPLIVLCDDAYFGLNFEEDSYEESPFTLLAGCHPNLLAVKIDGVSKEFYARGSRVGFITFGGEYTGEQFYDLEQKSAAFIRGSISNISHANQSMISTLMQDPIYLDETKQNHSIMKDRYQTVKDIVYLEKYQSYFTPLPFNAGYFMAVKLHQHEAEDIRKRLLADYSIGIIAFQEQNIVRIAYSCVPKAKLPEIFEAIYELCLASS